MEGMPFEGQTGERLRKALFVTVILLGVFLGIQALVGLMSLRYIGTGVAATNTIAVSGHGEMVAVPDIATFSFSVVSQKASVADAQSDAATKANTITAYLKGAGIDEKDIKTSDYSINPQYEYQNAACPVVAPTPAIYDGGGTSASSVSYCPPGRQVLKGYEVRQTTSIKVRDTKKAGDILAGVGSKGATEVSGLQFTFDDPTGVQTAARDKAIADAKTKAQALAKQLGVSLVRVVSFNENGSGGYPAPMAYSSMAGAQANDKAVAPTISVGQNKTTDDVSITYEIR